MQKGGGYHLDMLVVGLMTGVCSVVGLPWCVAATVLCLGHVDSLKMDTESSAPGEPPRFLGVRQAFLFLENENVAVFAHE
jgi:hypothetical protein